MADLIGRAPGKLLLFGEHAAVYGEPAIGISLPWTAELRITRLDAAQYVSCERLPPLPAALAPMLAEPPYAAEIEIRSHIPIGLGFGSSAALCVAAERALAGAGGAEPAGAAVWSGAHEREKVFHGTPSGADTGLAAHPGVGFLSWPAAGSSLPRYEPLPSAELHLVVGAVAQRLRTGDSATRDAPRRLGQCSREGRALHPTPLRARPGRKPAVHRRLLPDLPALGDAGDRGHGAVRGGRVPGGVLPRDSATTARRNLLLALITVPFWTNLLIRTYCWVLILRDTGLINNVLLATGVIQAPITLLYTYGAILLGLVYTYVPFMVLPVYAAIERLDRRLLEAAHDLYAGRRRALQRVVVPLAAPGIAAGAILVFIPSVGAFIAPDLLGGGKNLMLGSLIQLQFASSRNWPFGSAVAMLLLAVVLILLLCYARTAAGSRHS